jgi:hypothetical protein
MQASFPLGQHDDQVDAAVYGVDLGAVVPYPFPLAGDRILYSLRRGITGQT